MQVQSKEMWQLVLKIHELLDGVPEIFFFFFYRVTCGILVLQPGIEPTPLAVKLQSLNHWITKDIPLGGI